MVHLVHIAVPDTDPEAPMVLYGYHSAKIARQEIDFESDWFAP